MISSLQHPLVKHLVKLRTSSSYRDETKTCLLEGSKIIQEVTNVNKILYTSAYSDFVSKFKCEKWLVTEAILHKISGVIAPEGIIAEVSMPKFSEIENVNSVLALDGISDPGNLGTLLRTALALGWTMVYFLPGCCDPFNDKSMRAARGAHFKIQMGSGTIQDLENWVKSKSVDVQALVADLEGISLTSVEKASRRLLILSNEAHGPSTELYRFCQKVTIPMTGKMESLNVAVAGGILLYHLSNVGEKT